MPLTPAHAAAAWPLNRWLPRLPLGALVIGTMTPDFRYLLTLQPLGANSHSLLGLLVFCLPVGFTVWLAYRHLVRPALVDLLPPAAQRALAAPGGSVTLYASALVAVLLGAFSHIAWDSFTHDYGFMVWHIAALRAEGLFGIRWYKVLQHGSTVVGLVIVAYWVRGRIAALPAAARVFSAAEARRVVGAAAILLGIAVVAGVANGARASGLRLMLGYTAIGGMAGLAVALFVFGVWAATGGTSGSSPRYHRVPPA